MSFDILGTLEKFGKLCTMIHSKNTETIKCKPMLQQTDEAKLNHRVKISYGSGKKEEFLASIVLKNKGDLITIRTLYLNKEAYHQMLDIYQEETFSIEIYAKYEDSLIERALLTSCEFIAEDIYKNKYLVLINVDDNLTPTFHFQSNNDIVPLRRINISWWELIKLKFYLKKCGNIFQEEKNIEKHYTQLLDHLKFLRFVSEKQIEKIHYWICKYFPQKFTDELKLITYINKYDYNHIL